MIKFQEKLFRKSVLAKMTSPEQLDQALRVTRPSGWLSLLAVVALILAALAWGIFGTLSTMAEGPGMLLRQSGVVGLTSTGHGQVEAMLVAVGDHVEKGQVVATVRQELMQREIADLEQKRAELDALRLDLERYIAAQTKLDDASLAQRRQNLEQRIGTLEREQKLLEESVTARRELLEDGLITQQMLLTSEQQLNLSKDRLASARLELNGLALERLKTEQDLEQRLELKRAEIREVDLRLSGLRDQLAESIQVVSTHAGRVIELIVNEGDLVGRGSLVLNMEVDAEELMAVVFVPASLGKQVEVGMQANISPSNVQREEYGFLLGTVTRVADFPSTTPGLLRLLANDDLVSKLMEEEPPIRVDVALERNPETPTGYAWSSRLGPEQRISSGTVSQGSLIVRQDRPISLVIPLLRKKMNL
ncbi:MAG: NHLP bacteriocin system secretion protein [Acidobacteriota bacterium]